MRFVTQFQGIRRRAMLSLVVVALMMALLPTAAFASSGRYGNYSPKRPAQQYNYRQPKQQRHVPKQSYCSTSYKVRKGDTLTKIARHYRVSINQLSKTNGIKNPNRIYAGQHLCIKR